MRHIAPDVPNAFIDRDALEKSLRNILDNAVKYSPDGGRIDVLAQVEGESVLLAIQDHGPGIPVEVQSRIGRPFEQIAAPLEDGYKGSGLGLAIAQSIAQAHGGQIALANRPEGGLRATLTLPR